MNRIRRPVPEAKRCTSSFLASVPATWKTWWVISATGELSLIDGVQDVVVQKAVDEFVDAVVQGRGKQQPLATPRGGGQDPGDTRQEPEVGHVIGFVDHGDLDGSRG